MSDLRWARMMGVAEDRKSAAQSNWWSRALGRIWIPMGCGTSREGRADLQVTGRAGVSAVPQVRWSAARWTGGTWLEITASMR